MRLVFRTLADPLANNRNLLLGERRLFGGGRGHDFVGIVRHDALQEQALLGLARHDSEAGWLARLGEVGPGMLLGVEAEGTQLVFGVRAVAGEAVVRQNRAHLTAEGNLLHRRSGASRRLGLCLGFRFLL
jgi:hypothetical protein